ncbi:MAG: glutathione S-transferase family protein [Leptospira sp.]|nr:glutathione S-transferase family protein [Leptospira sp.]
MFHLYSHPNSTYSQRVLIYFAYRNLHFENTVIALEKLENRKRPFLAVNPYGKVPVLADGDFIVSESQAIIQYLERVHSFSDPLFPNDPKLVAKLYQMMLQTESEFCFPGSTIYFAKRYRPEETWDLKRMKDSSKKIGRHLEILEEILKDQEYLFQNQFGILEILYAPFINTISYLDVKLPEGFEAWMNRVLEKEFVKTVLQKSN